MNEFLTILFHGAGTFLLFLILHVIVWREVKGERGVLLLWKLAAGIYIASAVFALFFLSFYLSSLWGSFSLYAFLMIAYTRFYITLTRTLTLRFSEELLVVPGKTMDEARFKAIYPPRHSFVIRLLTLKEHGWITESKDGYLPTAKCKAFGWLIRTLRGFYGIKRAG